MLLLNESFASTREREGSEIARQIVQALVERSINVLYVTHLYELALSLYQTDRAAILFLRAERTSDSGPTFQLTEAEPLPTSFGADIYQRMFEADGRSTQ